MLASKIVESALSNPFFTASRALVVLFFSSLILSKTKTLASTAIPMVKTIPAMPGKVNVAPILPSREIIINKLALAKFHVKTMANKVSS